MDILLWIFCKALILLCKCLLLSKGSETPLQALDSASDRAMHRFWLVRFFTAQHYHLLPRGILVTSASPQLHWQNLFATAYSDGVICNGGDGRFGGGCYCCDGGRILSESPPSESDGLPNERLEWGTRSCAATQDRYLNRIRWREWIRTILLFQRTRIFFRTDCSLINSIMLIQGQPVRALVGRPNMINVSFAVFSYEVQLFWWLRLKDFRIDLKKWFLYADNCEFQSAFLQEHFNIFPVYDNLLLATQKYTTFWIFLFFHLTFFIRKYFLN